MPKERRYTQYKQEDVLIQMLHYQSVLKIQVIEGSLVGSSVSLLRLDKEKKRLRAVILARASDWYVYSLNSPLWDHGITAVICGTHDSCLPVPVLALDSMKWYEPKEIRDIFGMLQPRYDEKDKPIPDTFDQARKSHYGHQILLGALMCGREDARARLQSLNERTRRRIEAELRNLHNRRRGRPLEVAPDPVKGKPDLSRVS